MSAFANNIQPKVKEETVTTAPEGEKEVVRGATAQQAAERRGRGRPVVNLEMPESFCHIHIDDDLKDTFFTRVDEAGNSLPITMTSIRLPDEAIQSLNAFNTQNNITTAHLIVLGMQKLRES